MDKDIGSKSYLTFMLGDEKFALSVDNVHEVVEFGHFTKVPETPEYIVGIINLRGSILPVLDTRLKLGLQKAERTDKNRVLILDIKETDHKTTRIGAIVDVACEVVQIDDQAILKPNDIASFKNSTPVTGIINDEGDITIVIDIERVFPTIEITNITETLN